MIYYAIRHKESSKLMPEVRTRNGYSHWNPSNPNAPESMFHNNPRLFDTENRAKLCIAQWFACQNGIRSIIQSSHTGEYDEIVDIKKDNRKKEDLEIVKVQITIRK